MVVHVSFRKSDCEVEVDYVLMARENVLVNLFHCEQCLVSLAMAGHMLYSSANLN